MRGQSSRLVGWLAAVVAAMMASATWSAAWAVEPDEILPDARLESRARALSLDLRCLVCQNQSIDDSNAPLAKDLRLLVRERLKAGDSDADVMKFIVARYGDFVLLKPPLNWKTLLLWLSAPALLLGVGFMLWRAMLAGTSGPIGSRTAPLSRDEEERVRRLLADADQEHGGR